jgi:hypothetical protein
MSRISLQGATRIALFGAAAVCALIEPLALFVGGMATDSGTPTAFIFGAFIAGLPLATAASLVVLANWLKQHTRFNILGLLLACVVFAALAWLGVWLFISHQGNTAPPEMAQGADLRAKTLKVNDPLQSQRWSMILARQFPVGSPAARFDAALKREGFGWGMDYTSSGTVAQQTADYTWTAGGCNYDLGIYWTANHAGRITMIRGTSSLSGCNLK